MSAAFKAVNFFASLFQMFLAHSRIHSFSPKLETRFFQIRTHQFNYFELTYSELKFDGFKRSTVFPRHFDDSVDLFYVEVFIHFLTFIVRSFDKLRMTSLILTFTLCCQAVLVEAFTFRSILLFLFWLKNHFRFSITSFAVLKCCFVFLRHFLQCSQHHSQSWIFSKKIFIFINKIPKQRIPFFIPFSIRIIAHFLNIIAPADVRFRTHLPAVRKTAHSIHIRSITQS